MMAEVEVTAPGKTILHGEHAVVYGKAAIAMSLSLKTHVSLKPHIGNNVTLQLSDLGYEAEWDVDVLQNISCINQGGDVIQASEDYLQNICKRMKPSDLETDSRKQALLTFIFLYVSIYKKYKCSLPALIVNVDSQLSIGAGMGSSASYSVCIAAALLVSSGKIKSNITYNDKDLICKWAFQAEKIFHGKPSGIDNSICTFGGAVLFRNGFIADRLSAIPPVRILLVNTKLPRNTKTLVADTKRKSELYPSVIEPVMTAIDAISDQCWSLLQRMSRDSIDEEIETFECLVRMNHHLLNCLGVGHPKLNMICEIAETHHCAAKLTGAGGGGCAFILLQSDRGSDENTRKIDKLKEQLLKLGFEFWDVILGSHGVEIKVTELQS